MTWLTRMHLRTWQHHMTTIMQPFRCDLQLQIQETNRTTHAGTTTRCRTRRRNRLTSKRSKPHPPHTGGTFHRRLQPLYTEEYKVSCSGFRPPPQNKAHATIMQPLQCVLQHHLHIHAAITMRFASTRCRTPRENRFDPETTAAAPAAHRRYLSSPAAFTLHDLHIHAAITM